MLATITKTQYKVSDFLSWQRGGSLKLSPKFQRRAVWSHNAKSFLIDSLIKNYPVPILFLRNTKTDLKSLEHKREMIDGQQRIRTVLSFIAPKSLSDFNANRDEFVIKPAHNREFAGKGFKELPIDVQQSILDYEFSVHILPSSVGDREIIQLFARLNSTGVKVNDQELRNAQYFGEFKVSMFQLAAEQLQRWRDWKILSEENIARMQEVELTSEFVQFILVGIVAKSQPALNGLYLKYDDEFEARDEAERRFRAVMDSIDGAFGDQLPQTVFRRRAPFFALFLAIYTGLYGDTPVAKRGRAKDLPAKLRQNLQIAHDEITSKSAPDKVLNALARRTTNPESRRAVVEYLKQVCKIG